MPSPPPRRRRTLAPETVKLNVDEVRESIARAQRKQAALVVLQGSESEIGAHVFFDKEKNAFFLEDLNSTNGTLLNGKRLTGAKRLEAGDRIYLGACVIKFT